MRPKLSDRSIRYLIRQLEGGRDTKVVAGEVDVTQRHVQRLWAEYLRTGTAHIQRLAGRPKNTAPSDEEIQMVLDAYHRRPDGVLRTAKALRKEGHDISYSRVYQIMKSHGLVVDSPAKSRKRKWVRYERLYSNAMCSNPRCASKRLSRHHLTEWRVGPTLRVGPTQIFLAISCRFRHK